VTGGVLGGAPELSNALPALPEIGELAGASEHAKPPASSKQALSEATRDSVGVADGQRGICGKCFASSKMV
jgi:hypothetical protein